MRRANKQTVGRKFQPQSPPGVEVAQALARARRFEREERKLPRNIQPSVEPSGITLDDPGCEKAKVPRVSYSIYEVSLAEMRAAAVAVATVARPSQRRNWISSWKKGRTILRKN